jgi:NAD+ dependent glucose-6-phosphate dehydrogenase
VSAAAPDLTLLTGAAGALARLLIPALAARGPLRLSDHHPIAGAPEDAPPPPAAEFVAADLTDLPALRAACQGVTTVIHLGAERRPEATWDRLLPANLLGTHNLFQAAAEAGCQRVIFASSIQARWGYPPAWERARPAVMPWSLYGASKAWGEAVGGYYASQRGLSVICLRIGWVLPADAPQIRPRSGVLTQILTQDDFRRAVLGALDAPLTLRFALVHLRSLPGWRGPDVYLPGGGWRFRPRDNVYRLALRRLPAAVRRWGRRRAAGGGGT